ncbi:MAG: type I phosphomannose isomerase catalytic subunit [Opitutaceae bacterium]
MFTSILRFQPLYQERVWGARTLADRMGRSLPPGRPIGESWEIVDRPEAQSVVVDGPFAGMSLRALIEAHGDQLMGPAYDRDRPFPILVKWLDCADRLSLQVHPPAAVADQLGGEPKTENWYIASARPGAHLIVGLKNGVTREAFESAMANSTLEQVVHRFPVSEGDSILVESGRLHAIDAGNLILEIQQNSDTTYRVYDWGRTGLDGKPRQLHVGQSMRSIDFGDFEPQPLRFEAGDAVLAECREFRIRRFTRNPGSFLRLTAGEEPRILSVIAGRVRIAERTLREGDNVILPWSGDFALEAEATATFLLTDHFA